MTYNQLATMTYLEIVEFFQFTWLECHKSAEEQRTHLVNILCERQPKKFTRQGRTLIFPHFDFLAFPTIK